jgi:REP element-mobilizing transposase RayT
MATARARLVDATVTRWYHCISRCVRRAFLLNDGPTDRKAWIENRLQTLAEVFAVTVGGFSILDNHLHVLLRLDPDAALPWTDEDVVRRWAKLYPPRNRRRELIPVSDPWIQEKLRDQEWVASTRVRLQSLSEFMKCLKEPLARLANEEDDCHGAFFEQRFKSIAILDEAALLAISVYVDLNPVAAGVTTAPEESPFTSIHQRAEHIQAQGRTTDLAAAAEGSVPGSLAAAGIEESLWLCPIEDRRGLDSVREGMFQGLSIGNYFLLVDYAGRMFREGKVLISSELAGILERLKCNSTEFTQRLEKLHLTGRWLGRFFAASRARLREAAVKLNVRHLINLNGCPS